MKFKFALGTFAAVASLQLFGVEAYDMAEFSKGMSTGVFAEDDGSSFEDYSCPEMQPFMVRS